MHFVEESSSGVDLANSSEPVQAGEAQWQQGSEPAWSLQAALSWTVSGLGETPVGQTQAKVSGLAAGLSFLTGQLVLLPNPQH